MTLSIGTDIVEVKRIAGVVARQGDRFAQRILCASELLDYQRLNRSVSFLAKRFAAKEAVAKALGTGIGHGVSFQDIIIDNTERGVPVVALRDAAANVMRALGGSRLLLSLADEQHYAIAYVTLV